MTKNGETPDRVQSPLSNDRQGKSSRKGGVDTPSMAKGLRLHRLGLLLAGSLSLGGCSLSMPEQRELFSSAPAPDGGTGQPQDGSIDAMSARDGGGTPPFDAAAPIVEAGGDEATQEDASEVADAAQDAGPTAFNPELGLVTHYRFNESSGNTVNDFAGDKDALIVGTPSGHEQWVAAGRIDGALRLAGVKPDGGVGHHVELPPGALLGLDRCTISLWLNRAGGPMWQRVIDFGSGPPVWLYFTPLGGTGLPIVAGRTPALIFVDYMALPDAPANHGQLRITQPIPVSTWTHFALTWDASEMKVYMNGKLAAQAITHAGVTPTDLGNTGQNYLGRSQFEADPYFNGLLDDFRLYNRVLSATEVDQLYNLR